MDESGETRRVALRRGLECALGQPFTDGNSIEVLRNGDEIFPAMLAAIRQARCRIEFVTFVYWTGGIAQQLVDALSERARSGVQVMVMLDGFGANKMKEDLLDQMRQAGCRILWFRPLPRWRVWQSDNRTHRKVLVCDGEVGFTGGVGIAAEWEGNADSPHHWRDNHFRIRGPAVRGLRGAFYGDWMEMADTVEGATLDLRELEGAGPTAMQVVLSQASIGLGATARLQDALILLAKERIRVQTPYFVPGDMQTGALLNALKRGVEVEFMIPGPHVDKRVAEYAGSDGIVRLLEAGLKLWRYQPTLIHSKLVTVDGLIASVGSTNFNQRTILKDNEVAVNVLDSAFTSRMDEIFEADRENCELSALEEWRRRGWFRRGLEWLGGLFRSQT